MRFSTSYHAFISFAVLWGSLAAPHPTQNLRSLEVDEVDIDSLVKAKEKPVEELKNAVFTPATPVFNVALDKHGHSGEARPFPDTIEEFANHQGPDRDVLNSTTSESFSPFMSYSAQTYDDLLGPIALTRPSSVFPERRDHQVPRTGIEDRGIPLQTNKFYTNFLLGERRFPTWTHPYKVWWLKEEALGWHGLAVDHSDRKKLGPDNWRPPAEFYINPNGVHAITLGAKEFGSQLDLSVNTLTDLSANIVLRGKQNPQAGSITFPLHQGMGFVTALYTNLTPRFFGNLGFNPWFDREPNRSPERAPSPRSGITKYRIRMGDESIWLMYIIPTDDKFTENRGRDSGDLGLVWTSPHELNVATDKPFTGIIQLAKLPTKYNSVDAPLLPNSGPDLGSERVQNTARQVNPDAERLYDEAAGTFATGKKLFAKVEEKTGTYGFEFQRAGVPGGRMMNFALPHQIASLVEGERTSLQMVSTSKGMMTALLGDKITMRESTLPVEYGIKPLNPSGQVATYSDRTLRTMLDAFRQDLTQDFTFQTNLDSMYWSGKAMSKFALLCWQAIDVFNDRRLARECLDRLKPEFYRFSRNQQKAPLVYDSAWGGVITSQPQIDADFGNPGYNDHHFHYGYHIHAAALMVYVERALGGGEFYGSVAEYVTALIRDFANPSTKDKYFPVFRSFDWFHGHSWARGLFESGDGKDQESTSEDAFAYYAVKIWAQMVGDKALEDRSNLMLAVLKRSLNEYFLMSKDNKNHPRDFIDNKVAGILFENKVHHTTWFGANIEFIQGIHMLPISAISPYMRPRKFVQEEWDQWFTTKINEVDSSWKGLLMANKAIIDPQGAWRFFTGLGFKGQWIDGGASRSWYSVFAAALGGGEN
ncbi:glycoside hydrolase [Ascobolus immersus RN42]|uniref:glucan endo-1,3-beta-D-glucosidase n=1 Tax=Ascobolus immersus RN42 TaxID=1160509 RepID=A0A3N4I8C9_ASCIM|nr:glycoside hydrolase [Ascobolus immersus RN42]